MGIKIYNHKGEFGVDIEEKGSMKFYIEDMEEHQIRKEAESAPHREKRPEPDQQKEKSPGPDQEEKKSYGPDVTDNIPKTTHGKSQDEVIHRLYKEIMAELQQETEEDIVEVGGEIKQQVEQEIEEMPAEEAEQKAEEMPVGEAEREQEIEEMPVEDVDQEVEERYGQELDNGLEQQLDEELDRELEQKLEQQFEQEFKKRLKQELEQELRARAEAEHRVKPVSKDKVNLEKPQQTIIKSGKVSSKDSDGKASEGKAPRKHDDIQRRKRTSRLRGTDKQSISMGTKRVDNIKFEMNKNGCFINGRPFDPKNPPQGLAIAVDQKTAKS
ncbi:MAG: hypothetical protein ACOYEJ_04815 [Mahellales bacterium]|jgi:hypothetical protein